MCIKLCVKKGHKSVAAYQDNLDGDSISLEELTFLNFVNEFRKLFDQSDIFFIRKKNFLSQNVKKYNRNNRKPELDLYHKLHSTDSL